MADQIDEKQLAEDNNNKPSLSESSEPLVFPNNLLTIGHVDH